MNTHRYWEVGIYQEVDGSYYYDPSQLGAGSYSSKALREIAERLDALNRKIVHRTPSTATETNCEHQRPNSANV